MTKFLRIEYLVHIKIASGPICPQAPSRSPSIFHGMSNARSCALDANGKLMDASEIVWYNDPDDAQPLSSKFPYL